MHVEREERSEQRKDAGIDHVEPELLAIDGAEHLGGALALAIGRTGIARIGTARPVFGHMADLPGLRAIDRTGAEEEEAFGTAFDREVERMAGAGDDRVEHAARVIGVECRACVGGGVDHMGEAAAGRGEASDVARDQPEAPGEMRHFLGESGRIAAQDRHLDIDIGAGQRLEHPAADEAGAAGHEQARAGQPPPERRERGLYRAQILFEDHAGISPSDGR